MYYACHVCCERAYVVPANVYMRPSSIVTNAPCANQAGGPFG